MLAWVNVYSMIGSFCRRDYSELKEYPGQYTSFPFLTLPPAALLAEPGILVCHQRSRSHPSGARLAARSDAKTPAQPRWFFTRVQGELLPPASRLERLERFEQLERAPFYGVDT